AAPGSGASATLSSGSAVTNASGVASITATANATLGSYSVTASVNALTANFALSNVAGPPASVTASGGTPQSTAVGTAFPSSLQVTVKDSNGDVLSGVAVTFTAPNAGASATLSNGSAATTNASGVASITATANGTVGPYSVTASVGALTATFS